MDAELMEVFRMQVREQCKYVAMAAREINVALDEINTAAEEINQGGNRNAWRKYDRGMNRFWYSLQNLVIAAANVSKALWGSGGKLTEERRTLRQSMGVGDSSPLQATDLRNDFEHFDSRLDKWHKESASHQYLDHNIGTGVMFDGSSYAEIDCFRNFDGDTGEVRFWGTTFDLSSVVLAAGDVLMGKAHGDSPSNSEGNSQ
jgi:hypothetical protein